MCFKYYQTALKSPKQFELVLQEGEVEKLARVLCFKHWRNIPETLLQKNCRTSSGQKTSSKALDDKFWWQNFDWRNRVKNPSKSWKFKTTRILRLKHIKNGHENLPIKRQAKVQKILWNKNLVKSPSRRQRLDDKKSSDEKPYQNPANWHSNFNTKIRMGVVFQNSR